MHPPLTNGCDYSIYLIIAFTYPNKHYLWWCQSYHCENKSKPSGAPCVTWPHNDHRPIKYHCTWDMYLEFSPNVLFHPAVARIVQDHYMSRYQQAWISCINKEFNPNLPNKLKSYASFKTTFSMENYVSSLPLSKRRSFTKLRASSQCLAIETGRYTRPITPRSQRFCNHCTQNVLGDEMHFILSCSKFGVQRKPLFDDLEVFGNIRICKDFKTFFTVMNYGHGDIQVAHKICKFVTDCFSLQPG